MICNDSELEGTQTRIALFQKFLAAARKAETPSNYQALSQNYLLEIDKMQAEIRDYLCQVEMTRAA